MGLLVWYRNESNAWMSESIFKEGFFQQYISEVEHFLKTKSLPRKTVLVLDNVLTHPDRQYLKGKDIKVIFLPPNVTSMIQQMNQGILTSLKKIYQQKFLSSLILALEDSNYLVSKLKKIDLLHIIGWVDQCWNELQSITLVPSWGETYGSFG